MSIEADILAAGVVQVTTYGGPGDPYRWIRERFTWRGDVLEIERTVMARGQLAQVEINASFSNPSDRNESEAKSR